MSRKISLDDLHAYVDGQLDPRLVAEVEAHLEANPESRKRVEDYRLLNRALAAGLDPMLSEPVPPAHMATVLAPPRRLSGRIAAGLVIFALGLSGGWLAHLPFERQRDLGREIASRTTAAYTVYAPEVRHPVEVYADDADHLQAWLSNRMGMAFVLPDLEDLGLKLVGGRMMAADRVPAAMLMYEGRADRRVVIYVRNDLDGDEKTAPSFESDDAAVVMVWRDGANGFGVSGDMSRAELAAIAQAVRVQFTT